jgi:hypothetical protein
VERKQKMAKKLDVVMKALPLTRRKKIQQRTMELATLKDLRKAAEQTLGVEKSSTKRKTA